MCGTTIKQPDLVSCGVACAAMITATSFEQAKQLMKPHPNGGYDVIEIHKYCLDHGITIRGCCYGHENEKDFMQVDDHGSLHIRFNPNDIPMLVGVNSERIEGGQHWIYWCGEHIHDPNPYVDDTKRSLGDYQIIDFGPVLKISERRQ